MLTFILNFYLAHGALGIARVRDYRTETNAGNENVGYQGCNI
jgi:hypothetical protein